MRKNSKIEWLKGQDLLNSRFLGAVKPYRGNADNCAKTACKSVQ